MDLSKSYFGKNIESKARFQTLTTDTECDVVIVGGGISGCILAYYLEKTGLKIILVEKDRVACNFTSYNNSILNLEFNINSFSAKRSLKKCESLKHIYKVAQNALLDMDEIINTIGGDNDYAKKDSLVYTTRKRDIKAFECEGKLRNEAGILTNIITGDNSDFDLNFKMGLVTKDGARIFNPVDFCYNVLEFCKKVKVYENTSAEYIEHDSEFSKLITDGGNSIMAKYIIYTSPNFMQQEEKSAIIFPQKIYTIISEQSDSFHNKLKDTTIQSYGSHVINLRILDNNRIMYYKISDEGGELLEENENVFSFLIKKMHSVHASTKSVGAEYQYTTSLYMTKDNLPYIFSDNEHPNVLYMLMAGSLGTMFAVPTSQLLAKFVTGERSEMLDKFKIDR